MPLGARLAIEELNTRFAWALDLQRFDELRELFTPDATYVSGSRTRVGVDELVEGFVRRTGERTTRHGYTALLLTAEEPGEVTGQSCWHTYAANAARPVTGTGVYLVADFHDTYIEREGRWWISRRVIEPVFYDPRLAPVT